MEGEVGEGVPSVEVIGRQDVNDIKRLSIHHSNCLLKIRT